MKEIINPNELSFNNLDEKVAIEYLLNNGYFHNPFKLPDNVKLINPFTGHAIDKNGKPINMGDEIFIIRNPFNSKIIGKIEYKNGKPFKKWDVNDKNKWVEIEFNKKA
jgi:hypothetical protein